MPLQYDHIVEYLESLWAWVLARLTAMVGRLESDHVAMQRFKAESVELLKRLSSLKASHLSLAALVIIVVVLVLSLGIWRFRVSRYNEFWGLKKSVHFWTSFRTSAQPHYCSACSQLICGFWIFRNTGWECTVCGRTAHLRCLAACDKFDCKCPSQPEPLRHQLVQGNLPSDSVCGACGIICASPFGLHGLRCLWCGRTVHEDCLRHLPEICDLGPFQSLLLPPNLIRLSVTPSRLSHSLKSFKSFFHSKKSSAEAPSEEASIIADPDQSGSTQRYLSQMGTQLKEGLSQVQIAMAAGLFEGLKEVTADVRRINQLVKQEFRRRMKRELHQQQIESQMMKFESQQSLLSNAISSPDSSTRTPQGDTNTTDGLTATTAAITPAVTPPTTTTTTAVTPSNVSGEVRDESRVTTEQQQHPPLTDKPSDSTAVVSGAVEDHHSDDDSGGGIAKKLKSLAGPVARGIVDSENYSKHHNYARSEEPGGPQGGRMSNSDNADYQKRNLSFKAEEIRQRSKGFRISSDDHADHHHRHDSTTTDETPNGVVVSSMVPVIDQKRVGPRESPRSRSLERCISAPNASRPDKAEIPSGLGCPGSHYRRTIDRTVVSRGDSHRDHHRASIGGTTVSESSNAAQSEARLKSRQQRLRRLEQKQLTAVAGSLVAREDRYDDRLFELAKLMPAKADVWEIEVFESFPLVTAASSHWPSPGDSRSRQRAGKNGAAGGTGSKRPRPTGQPKEMSIPISLLDRKPLLVFVNVKSGGQVGAQLMKEFYKVLNPMQVVDIQSDGGPQRALQLFKSLADVDRLRVLVCGGDGTAGWVMEEIRRLYGPPTECHVPVGILPLGTGNDLARVLGWGDSFDGDIHRCLLRVQSAQTRLLDQWSLKIHDQKNKTEVLNTYFNNYMDIGVAARISLKFHQLREAHPELFQSRLGNKFLYGEMGVREWVTEKTVDLSKVRIWCDGLPVILSERKIEGLVVVNIPSFGGGVNLWNDEDLDVVGTDFRHYRYDTSCYHPLEPVVKSHMSRSHILSSSAGHQSPETSTSPDDDSPVPAPPHQHHRSRRRLAGMGSPALLDGETSPSSSLCWPLLSHRDSFADRSRQNDPGRLSYSSSSSSSSSHARCPKPTHVSGPIERWKRRAAGAASTSHSPHRDLLQDSHSSHDSIVQERWVGRQRRSRQQRTEMNRSVEPSLLSNAERRRPPRRPTTEMSDDTTQQREGSTAGGNQSGRRFHSHHLARGFTALGRSQHPMRSPRRISRLPRDEALNYLPSDRSVSDRESIVQRHQHRSVELHASHRRPNQMTTSKTVCPLFKPAFSGSSDAALDQGVTYSATNHSQLATRRSGTGFAVPASFAGRKCPISGGIFRRWQKQSMRDELIEVVALRSLFHLGQIQVGLAEPLKVCQGRDIRIEVPVEVPFQIDGEPRLLPPHTTIDISYKGKCFVLSPVKSHDDVLLLTVTEVLDAAVRDAVLSPLQRNCLLWELESRMR